MTVCLQLGWGGMFAYNPYSSLVSFRTFFIFAKATASPLEEDFQDRSLRTDYSWRQFRCPLWGQCQDQYHVYSVSVFEIFGALPVPHPLL